MAQRERTEVEIIRGGLGAWDSIYVPSFRLAPYNPDLLTTQKGFDTYDKMLTSAACRAPLNVKRYAVLHKGWQVQSAVTDPADSRHAQATELATFVQTVLSDILNTDTDETQDFRSVLFELMMACWCGFQVSEIEWRYLSEGPYAGKLGLKRIAAKPAKQIGFDLDPDTLAIKTIRPYTPMGGYGEPVAPQRVIRYTYNPQHGLPYGMGDGRSAYKHWWRLDATLKFWGVALEVWGVPFILAKYPSGNTKALERAIEALEKVRQGAPAVLPSDVDAQVIAGGAGGVLDVFRSAADWDTQQCALAVLGSTLTTGEGRRTGSLAMGEVHQDTQKLALENVKEDIEAVVTSQLIRRIVRYNFGPVPADIMPRLSLGEWDEGDRLKLAQMFDVLIADRVVARRAKFIRTELGLPPLDPEEEAMLDEEAEQERQMQQAQIDAKNTATGSSQGPRPQDNTDDDSE